MKFTKERKSIKNKGYYTIEASIVVPLVLIAIMSISAFGRIYGVIEKVAFVGADSARSAMINSYIVGNDLMVFTAVKNHLKSDSLIKNPQVAFYKSGYSQGGLDQLISFRILYGIGIKAPLWNRENNIREDKFLCRKFVGNMDQLSQFTFDRMEIEETDKIVYLFPLDGERYHSENCTYVVPKYYKKILNSQIKKEYMPCNQCDAASVDAGGTVYIFLNYGDYYHSYNCTTIRKNVVKATLSTALEKGYTPCSKCGGGQ